MPVLAPLTDAEWPPELADLRQGFAGNLNVYRVMAHNPALLRAWENLRGHIVTANALNPQQQSMADARLANVVLQLTGTPQTGMGNRSVR